MQPRMIDALKSLANGIKLPPDLAREAMLELMDGKSTPAQIGAFLMGLRFQGEIPEVIVALAQAMRERSVLIVPQNDGVLLDVCGTGGAQLKTFNISTLAAFVIAGAGIPVAKHGNRSNSSKCGSADLLEALGVNLESEPDLVREAIDEIGIGFLFAPKFHPAMRHAVGPRKELSFRTIFNLLGPLTNPAGANAHLLGVYHPQWVEVFPEVLKRLGVNRAMVVHGRGGIDEISTIGPTYVGELKGDRIFNYHLDPEEFGLSKVTIRAIRNVQPELSAQIAREILNGKNKGPYYQAILFNAGAGIYVGGGATTIEKGIELARTIITSGQPLDKLHHLIAKSRGD